MEGVEPRAGGGATNIAASRRIIPSLSSSLLSLTSNVERIAPNAVRGRAVLDGRLPSEVEGGCALGRGRPALDSGGGGCRFI
jgi:hypothetical protein